MPLNCPILISDLPVLNGCPGDAEYFLVGNAVGGIDAQGNLTFGYGLRTWVNLKSCLLGSVKQAFFQFRIGDSGSPMNVGDTQLVVSQANVIQDSVWVSLGSGELPREVTDQISYGVLYNNPGANQFTVNFDQAVSNLQLYIVHYSYLDTTASPVSTTLPVINFRVGDGGSHTPSAGSNVYNPPVNPFVGKSIVMVFQQGVLVSPSPTEVAGDINWTFDGTNLTLANGEFDNNTAYSIIYQ